ncbi:MAG: hypothetical protein ACRDD8_08235 [Bacteroidales bacterium]
MALISFWKGTELEYNNLTNKLPDRLYFVIDKYKIFLGTIELCNNNTTELDAYNEFATLAEVSTVWEEDPIITPPQPEELPSNTYRFIIRTNEVNEEVRVLIDKGEVIKWGDGTENIGTSETVQISHIYETPGEYTLDYVFETVPNFNPYYQVSQTIGIKAVGESSSTTFMFYSNFYKLEYVDCDIYKYNQHMTSAMNLFSNLNKLRTVSKDIFKSASNITDMKYLFNGCSRLESIPQGLFDNCVNVSEMFGLFKDCSSLETIPDGLLEHISKVSNFTTAFYGCSSLTHAYNCTLQDSPKMWERNGVIGNGFAANASDIFRRDIPTSWGGLAV